MSLSYHPLTMKNNHDRRLLIVNDESGPRQQLVNFFTTRGYKVLSAVDGVEALWQVLNQAVDAVLLKFQLPRLSGGEVAVIIKKIAPTVLILLLTSEELPANEMKSQQVDFIPLFVHPWNLERIEQIIMEKL